MLTPKAIYALEPCKERWVIFRKAHGVTARSATPVTLASVIETNGLDDALWCLQALGPDFRDRVRLLACDFADHVAHLSTDPRVAACIATARRHAAGEATDAELEAARSAAGDATFDANGATWADGASPWAAGRSTASAAWTVAAASAALSAGDNLAVACSAAKAAARATAKAAAYSVAGDFNEAAGNVAGRAERDWQAQRLREWAEAHGI